MPFSAQAGGIGGGQRPALGELGDEVGDDRLEPAALKHLPLALVRGAELHDLAHPGELALAAEISGNGAEVIDQPVEGIGNEFLRA